MDELWQAGEGDPGGDVVPPTIQGADPVVFDDVPMSRVVVSHRQGIGVWGRTEAAVRTNCTPGIICLLFPWLSTAANQDKSPRIYSCTLLQGKGTG